MENTNLNVNVNVTPNNYSNSYFDGGLLGQILHSLGAFFMTLLTLGLAFPWAICILYRWKAKHTVICGKRLKFVGSGGSLFGNYIKWWLLCIITFGIYSFWLGIAMEKWKIKNTVFEN